MKSEVNFKVNGVDRGFKFGTYTARLIEEKSGDKLSLFWVNLGDGTKLIFCSYCINRLEKSDPYFALGLGAKN